MTGLLDGKVAIITGGAKGLGAGISRRMAREGAKVVITGRDGVAAEAAAEAITRDQGVEALGFSCDMGVKDEVEAMVARTVERFGRLDSLVTNASLLSPNVLLENKTDEMLKQTLEIGTWGTWWAMRAAFPHLKERGGTIVNFYSIDAQTGAWLHSDYNMNKGAILALTRSAAVEWGRFNIRVNAIAPTGMGQVFAQLAKDVPGFLDLATANNPLLRAGDPDDDIGPVVVFLASEMSRFITGELINVDGGQNLPGYVSKPHNLTELEGGCMNIFTPLSTTTDASSSRDGGRLPTSVVKILEGALRGIASRGVKRLSMSDISDASGVSRGTLYRYFSTKEEVMAAVAEFVCTNFETGVLEAAEEHDDPIQRFRAVMGFFSRFTVERSPERMLEVEPSFYLAFFKSHFARHKAAVEAALARTFDYFDAQWGHPINRQAAAEALVRMQLSSLIVPTDANWTDLWENASDRMQYWISQFAGKNAPCKER